MFKVQVVFWLFSLVIPVVISRSGLIYDYRRGQTNQLAVPETGDNGEALFLTPYIEQGQIEKGQSLSKVPPLMKNIESFSGFLTVNKTVNSNLFFWLFKSQQGNWEERPLVIWLQGGPGASSLFGLFTELGPFSVTHKQKLKRREYSWNQKFNLVFFDNPVGAGFSFTDKKSGYVKDETEVARDLYEAIVQLYKLFPALQKNKLIITGESYAGKYIPAIGYKISKMNQVSTFKINLAGLMIGNGFTDPANMMDYASYLYKLGLVDKRKKNELHQMEKLIRQQIKGGKFEAASDTFSDEMTSIQFAAGLINVYDFVHDDIGIDGPELVFINSPNTRKAIHVGNYPFDSVNYDTYNYLGTDFMQSVKPWVEEMLAAEEFPIMFYSGQLDIIVAYAVSVGFYGKLKWQHASDYHKAERCQFRVNGETAGYYKTAGTFTEVMVRNTGHMVPTTQPKWAFELLDRFITNSTSFSTCG